MFKVDLFLKCEFKKKDVELNIYFNYTVNQGNFGVSGAFQAEKLALQFKNYGFRWTAGLNMLEVCGSNSE
jgi:hypothetical protein